MSEPEFAPIPDPIRVRAFEVRQVDKGIEVVCHGYDGQIVNLRFDLENQMYGQYFTLLKSAGEPAGKSVASGGDRNP